MISQALPREGSGATRSEHRRYPRCGWSGVPPWPSRPSTSLNQPTPDGNGKRGTPKLPKAHHLSTFHEPLDWSIENSCHYIIDWNFDEDRSRIRKGYGSENVTRLRRFAVSIIKCKGVRSVPQKMRQLTRNVRSVFDYLRMTENSCRHAL